METLQDRLCAELDVLRETRNIYYQILPDDAVLPYKEKWLQAFLPADSYTQQASAYDLCLCNQAYLWHIFSFDVLKSEDHPDEKFSALYKGDCTLFLSGTKEVVVRLFAAGELTKQDVEGLCARVFGWSDFVITADDFSWTYACTHERYLGPYFYRKGLKT